MKHLFAGLLLLISFYLKSQNNIAGYWYGLLKNQYADLILTLEFKLLNDSITGYLNSPMQGASNIKMNTVRVNNDSVHWTVKSIGAKFDGVFLNDSLISGTFNQAIFSVPVEFKRTKELFTFKRPQEPKPPFAYKTIEVFFENPKANITLAGTLTIPNNKETYPLVIFITGSGPQNRNEEIVGHKPFLVIADYLTKNGIATLRFDDRGFGKSKGNFNEATTLDFATDVEAAIDYVRKHPKLKISKLGLLGHSEGGMVAMIVGANRKDIDFMVLLAAPFVSGKDVILSQTKKIYELQNESPEMVTTVVKDLTNVMNIVLKNKDNQKAINKLNKYYDKQKLLVNDSLHIKCGYNKEQVNFKVKSYVTPWFRYFIAFEPTKFLSKVNTPIYALFGEKDVQVLHDINVEALNKIKQKNKNVKIEYVVFPDKNHLFQNSNTGLPNEYAMIEETIAEDVLIAILKWISKQANLN